MAGQSHHTVCQSYIDVIGDSELLRIRARVAADACASQLQPLSQPKWPLRALLVVVGHASHLY